jgi:FkbM family methyltransferase
MKLSLHKMMARLLSKIKFAKIGYSQEGEDIVVDRFLNYQKKGFFVDIGAHHPIYFSNTYRFYLRGWRGINVDAMPGSMTIFNKIRPHDTNIEMPVSDKEETLTFHMFNDPALNTFSEEEANKKNGLGQYRIIRTEQLKTFTLEKILDTHLVQGQKIDFLTIDVEGMDLKVLASNNWNKYRPTLVLIESLENNNDMSNVSSDPINLFMKRVGYYLVAKTLNTLFYKETQS